MQSLAQLFALAAQHHRDGRLQDAERLYRQILQADPRHADAMHLLGLLAHQVGRNDLAVTWIRQALTLHPNSFPALNNLALALRALGNLDEAIANYREAIRLKPDFIEAYNNLGNALKDRGDLDEAVTTLREGLRLRPDMSELYTNLGVVLKMQGKLDEAAANYREALRLRPDDAVAVNNLGIILQDQGNLDEAIRYYRESIRLKSSFVEAYNNLGVALLAQGRLDEALISLKEALNRKSDYAEAHNNLGNVLKEQHKRNEATASYREALRVRPDYAEAFNNLGIVLLEQGRVEDAVSNIQRALALKPDFADGYANLGNAYMHDPTKLDEAIASYHRALQLDPDHADAHFKLSLPLLQKGNFIEGWTEYEWRWRTWAFKVKGSKPAAQARLNWDGSPLQGRSILLHSEQGLGDTIQFVRYATLLKQQGAGRIVLACAEGLQRVMRTCKDIDEVHFRSLPHYDAGVFLLSLPRLMGTMSVEQIPSWPSYLDSEPELVAQWRERLAALDDGPAPLRVGIVWQGNPEHAADHWRSMNLQRLAPLAELPGVRLISLQKGYGADQLEKNPQLAVDLGPALADLADTAAVIRCLDLVITVDTAVAHLAGALGAPVWVALSTIADWRWLLQREDSPWYPSMRLFRQSKTGQWDEVIRRIRSELQSMAPGR